MATRDVDLSADDAAAMHAALGHPVRVVVLRLLRAAPSTPMADLRRAVADLQGPIDTRTLLHHLDRMHKAGIVDVERFGGRYRVHLVRDVQMRIRGR